MQTCDVLQRAVDDAMMKQPCIIIIDTFDAVLASAAMSAAVAQTIKSIPLAARVRISVVVWDCIQLLAFSIDDCFSM